MNFDSLLKLQEYFESQNFDIQTLESFLNSEFTDVLDIGTDDIREILESILQNSTGSVDQKVITLIWEYFKDEYGSTYAEQDEEWFNKRDFQSFEIDFYEYHYITILKIATHKSTPKKILLEIEKLVLPLANESELDIAAKIDLERAIKSNENYNLRG